MSDVLMSVVQYASEARITHFPQAFRGNPMTLVQRSGGTQFAPAAQLAKQLASRSEVNGMIPIVIFMSDGGTNDGDQATKLLHKINNVVVHTVAFGSAREDTLRNMATSATKHFHKAVDGAALAASFMRIATEVSTQGVSDKLSYEVSKKIAEEMQTKLISECL